MQEFLRTPGADPFRYSVESKKALLANPADLCIKCGSFILNPDLDGSILLECVLINRIVLAADPGTGGALMQFLLLFAPLFLIWYFLVILPQQRNRRKNQQMLSNLKTGDRVMTSGGIYGLITGFRGDIVQVQIANQVKVDIARSAITGVQGEGEEQTEQEKGSKGKK